ncbi:hypothetical protein [Spirosoma endbachense]|uniref:Phage integrase SAM-like domain-containing protein n=1 Tax=Spirosoma endbachense TaxID=2666025 RepID=A0A6P1VPW0_9BACT|nr:hypothetical protein [Spirosoma endbachense]QHV93737.1 hypothetical protein GJR95_01240 [Spirosoma endbachense]
MKLNPETGQFSLQQLTLELFDKYETHLLTRPPMRKTSTESSRRITTCKYLRKLHQHIRSFIIKYKLPDELDPLRVRTFKEAPTERIVFNKAEFQIWSTLTLPTRIKGERTRNHTRNIYLVSYYLHGLRAMDLMVAKVSQVQTIWPMKEGKIVQEYRFYTVAEKTNKSKLVLIEKRFFR